MLCHIICRPCEILNILPLRNINPVYISVTYQPIRVPDWWDKRGNGVKECEGVQVLSVVGQYTSSARISGGWRFFQPTPGWSAAAKDWNGSLFCLFLPYTLHLAKNRQIYDRIIRTGPSEAFFFLSQQTYISRGIDRWEIGAKKEKGAGGLMGVSEVHIWAHDEVHVSSLAS